MTAQLCPDSGFPKTRCERDCDWGSGCKNQRDRAERVEGLNRRIRLLEEEIECLRKELSERPFGMLPGT